MYVATHTKPITLESIAATCDALLGTMRTVEYQIALSERCAALLGHMAHHKKITNATVKPIVDAGIRSHITHRSDTVVFHAYGAMARANVDVVLPKEAPVKDLIAKLMLAEFERAHLAGLQAQFSHIQEIADTEQEIRLLAAQIAEKREALYMRLTGHKSSGYLHEAVVKNFQAIGQERQSY